MNTDTSADIAIIGAGVVGCAIAHELSLQFPEKRIVVLEKLGNAGLETSGNNSGVLHSGIHQEPKMLKSSLACLGNSLAVAYHQQKGLPLLHTGMIIALSRPLWGHGRLQELSAFFHLIKKGRAQHIRFQYLTPGGLKKFEPHLTAAGGIFIPNVWVIDFVKFVQSLRDDAAQNGVRFFFNAPVTSIECKGRNYYLHAGDDLIVAGTVINAAGLYADEVAHLAGFDQYKIFPWRGEYYEIIGQKQKLASRLIYPVVPPGSPGKGIHFSPRVDGRLFIGPNARMVPRKDYYEEEKTPREEFWQGAKIFFPELKPDDLRWAYSGIRAKLTDKEQETDFVISLDAHDPPFLNLIGIESPGLTAALAIAQFARNLLAPTLS